MNGETMGIIMDFIGACMSGMLALGFFYAAGNAYRACERGIRIAFGALGLLFSLLAAIDLYLLHTATL